MATDTTVSVVDAACEKVVVGVETKGLPAADWTRASAAAGT